MKVRGTTGAAIVALAALGWALGEDAIRFNTFPTAGSKVVITPRAEPNDTYDDAGISYAGNGYIDVQFASPVDITVDRLFFQCSDMYTPGLFHIDLYVNGAWMRYVSVVDIEAYYTLTDVEWDFETDLVLNAGDTVRLRFDHDVSMSTSGSTAARLVVSTNTYGALFTDVFGGPGYTPMALAAEYIEFTGSLLLVR